MKYSFFIRQRCIYRNSCRFRNFRLACLLLLLFFTWKASSASPVSADLWGGTDPNVQFNEGSLFEGWNVRYKAVDKDSWLWIVPSCAILERLQQGESVPEATEFPCFNLSFPVLDIKVVNNSANSIHVTRVKLHVSESLLDSTPVPVLSPDPTVPFKVKIKNEGWGQLHNTMLQFQVYHHSFEEKLEQGWRDTGREYFSIGPSQIDDVAIMNMTQAFDAVGINTSLIAGFCAKESRFTLEHDTRAQRLVSSALGPFADSGADGSICYNRDAIASGTLSYLASGEIKTVKFTCRVPISPPEGLGGVGVINGSFDTFLDVGASNYDRVVSVSQTIESGGFDRFIIRVGAPKTSIHRIDTCLLLSDGSEIRCRSLRIYIFVARSNAGNMRSAR